MFMTAGEWHGYHVGMTDLEITDDKENPNSFYALVSENIQNKIDQIPDSIMNMGESELKPYTTEIDMQVRLSIWHEYNRAQAAHRKMSMANATIGICSRMHFYRMTSDPHRLAFMLLQPPNYKYKLEEMLDAVLVKFRKTLEMPIQDETGAYDLEACKYIHKAALSLHEIVRGSVVQRHLNVNVEADKNTESVEDLDKQLEELRNKKAINTKWAEIE